MEITNYSGIFFIVFVLALVCATIIHIGIKERREDMALKLLRAKQLNRRRGYYG